MEQRLDLELTGWLAAWGGASVVGGRLLARRAESMGNAAWWAGFARQQVGWGAVDLTIAAIGAYRGRSKAPTAGDRHRLHRVLLINTALDVGYLAGALVLLSHAEGIAERLRRVDAETVRGDGAGILVQGGFLLLLDSVYAARTRLPG